MIVVSVKHNFETAHRLPFLPGKCQSVHGHSWNCEIFFSKQIDENGLTVEYGTLKKFVREWIDYNLDHGIVVGPEDPLVNVLLADGGKVLVLGPESPVIEATPYLWPTVENMALLLRDVFQGYCDRNVEALGYTEVTRVEVTETAVNKAVWTVETEKPLSDQ